MKKVNELIRNYEARGATPCKYDSVMGEKIGKMAASLINKGVVGGKAVVYFEGMNPFKQSPVVVPLVDVTNKNTLNNKGLYGEEVLKRNGVVA
jgi:6-phosphofructokinase